MTKRFLLDVDGPLTAGFVAEACRLLREHPRFDGRDKAHPENIREWNMMKALGVPSDIEEEVYDLLKQKDVAFRFAPNEGAKQFVANLQEWYGVELYVVTSPLGGYFWEEDRRRWLAEHFGIPKNHVASVYDKFIIRGDFLLDDKREHLVKWSEENPTGMAIKWCTPHNEDEYWKHEASRYEHVLDYVRQWDKVHG